MGYTFASVVDAQNQYNAAQPWSASQANAQLCLASIEYQLQARAKNATDQGSGLAYEALEPMRQTLIAFLGVGAPRAFGRRRLVGVAHQRPGVQ